jgi:hypothetical protein
MHNRAESAPLRKPGSLDEPKGKALIVTFQRSGNHEADVEQLRLLHALLTEFDGSDPFKFHLVGAKENGGDLEIDFPNHRTRYCPELERELVAILGPNCYRLE